MRLSKDDDGTGESASIQTQRKMLTAYAGEHAFAIHDYYVDDGYSGTTFDRPDFRRMIADIEAGHVNLVITKDLSRLGRDYITSGQYTELFFPERGVRYIAVNDGYDSDSPNNDIAPFRHVINEMYARDTSKKIRSAFKTKMSEGLYIGSFAPFGYRKDPENKNRLLVDEEAAVVVREIFGLARQGCRPSEISNEMNRRGILTPAAYRCESRPHLNLKSYSTRGQWTSSMICKLLGNTVYLGHTSQGKTTKVSFKSRVTISNAREDWYTVADTHEPLVSRETFDIVRGRSVSRRNAPANQFQNVFSGIAKCADCGRNMSTAGTRGKTAAAKLVCGSYKLYGARACGNHFIDYETLAEIVLLEIRKRLNMTEAEKREIIAALRQGKPKKQEAGQPEDTLRDLMARTNELDRIIRKLYEDNAGGKLSGGRFERLLAGFESEQRDIAAKQAMLAERASAHEIEGLENYIALLDDLTCARKLTPELLRLLVARIEVGQGCYESGRRGGKRQTVRIYYRFSGNSN